MSCFTVARALLAIGSLVTAAGFFVTLGGLSALQWQAFQLDVAGQTNRNEDATLTQLYTQTFQSGLYTPYPFQPSWQFAWTWFILFAELTVWLLTAALNFSPKLAESCKLLVVAWLSSFQVIIWEHINSVLYFSRSDIAIFAFGSSRINAALAGLFIVAGGNAIVITALALYNSQPAAHADPHSEIYKKPSPPESTV